MTLDGLGLKQGKAKLQHFRIDATHSNAYTAWQRIGSPAAPTAAQYKQLEAASGLARLDGAPASVDVADGRASLQGRAAAAGGVADRAGMVRANH